MGKLAWGQEELSTKDLQQIIHNLDDLPRGVEISFLALPKVKKDFLAEAEEGKETCFGSTQEWMFHCSLP